jgi:ATP-dependent exoDNAse (exonuclease V) alpha subunit
MQQCEFGLVAVVAIYHLSTKPISRSQGRSATAAAAYRAGELVHDLTTDEVFDYTRKRGVEHAEIVLPTEAARLDINWARDRESLWNAAEIAEKRKDARVAREYEVALPHELSSAQRQGLVRAFSMELANRYGVAVDFAIHAPHREGDERNHHAHILTTTRRVLATGLGEKASIEWSDTDRARRGLGPSKVEVKAVRERWAVLTNEHLKERGIEARVDHRSLEAQGIDREPQSHLGPAVSGMERRGISTEVGKRISWEAELAAQKRLEAAAELGKLAREREQQQISFLDLSGDLKLAKEERLRSAAELLGKDPSSGMSIAKRLDMLSDEVAKRLDTEAQKERTAREQESRRRGLDLKQQGLEQNRGRSIGDDENELKRKLDRGKDFGL